MNDKNDIYRPDYSDPSDELYTLREKKKNNQTNF